MKKPNPEYIERINKLVNNSPYFSLLSMKILDIGIGYSHLEIDISEKHLQPFGIVHGGVLASVIESVTSWAIFYGIEVETDGLTTIDLKLNYLSPAVPGKAIAEGRQIKLGNTVGYAEGYIKDEVGKIIAHGTSTLMIIPGRAPVVDPPFPPKFLE